MSVKERSQITATMVMVRPDYFGFNPQTTDNAFQTLPTASEQEVRDQALSEFDGMVNTLQKAGLEVVVLSSPLGENGETTPDAVFPNNWVSMHPGTLVLYPMKAHNRQLERQPEKLKEALKGLNILYPQTIDLTRDELTDGVLEGTGSLVLDRQNRIAYALASQRTSEAELLKWCEITGYQPHLFEAVDFGKKPIYHTNVAMSVGEKFAVVCVDSLNSPDARESLVRSLEQTGHEVLEISMAQMYDMCGNVLQTRNKANEQLVVMSNRARNAFTPDQLRTISKHGSIVPVALDTIEAVGGGSARCMMAEVFS